MNTFEIMVNDKKSDSLVWFYLLFAYVILQFSWWSYLMLDLNKEVTRLKTEQVLLKSGSMDETIQTEKELHAVLNKKRFMVIGEGVIFLALLLFGFIMARRSFMKETQLAQQQKNFLLSVTHELKSPIASARLQMETLLLRELDRTRQKEILENAIADTDRLNKLVENILMAAQIDKEEFSLQKEKANISEYISFLFDRPGPAADNDLRLSIQPGIYYTIDKIYFESIILNLVDNASKYSPPGSKIEVELKKTDGNICLNISDEGMGIKDEEKEKVFKKFYRVGNEETRGSKGTGLGLYIVKQLVEGHGGTIKITDNKPRGSIFRMEFNC